jgi:preprotein translocase subunit SecG
VTYILYFFHIIVSVFLILVVLLQQGKGADLSIFAGGSTQAVFGARGAATLLHKLTVAAFIVFTLTTLSISLFTGERGTVTSVLPDEPPAATAPAASEITPTEGTATTPANPATPAEGITDGITVPPADSGAAATSTPAPAENPGGTN